MTRRPFVDALRALIARPHGGVVLFAAVILFGGLASRLALLVLAAPELSWDLSLPAAFAWGLLYDLGTTAWLSLPVILALTLLPGRWLRSRPFAALAAACCVGVVAALACVGTAEFLFWQEFGVRANFIAVDYLIYTTEVLDNIQESYPLPLLLSAAGVLAVLVTWGLWRTGGPRLWLSSPPLALRTRWRDGLLAASSAVLIGSLVSSSWLPAFDNNYDRELAKNGIWSFVAAFKANELDFERFYATLPEDEVFELMSEELGEDGSIALDPSGRESTRLISNPGPEIRPNIIQITVESLSAHFLGCYDPSSELTPNLDALAEKSLLFENFQATGTRTVRGMEALTLSLPPTPGRSIVKRPDNEGLFTLGSVLRARGYETTFLYGGYGYFDNMNAFFGGNGYRIVDRASVGKEDVTFANAWGACDEDLFAWTLREADEAFARGRPFHHFVMTTSNHRPYTYPEGRIDLPPKVSGRDGAVKYTDHAIGDFLRKAAEHPWYDDTIFVIVADHCASSAGRRQVNLSRYHIPLLIFAPGGQVAPGRVATLGSQMDYAPTLLGLLGWSYPSRFLGHDLLRIDPAEGHALLGNYQYLGHREGEEFVLLEPRDRVETFQVEDAELDEAPVSTESRDETIAWYQLASHLLKHGDYAELQPREFDALRQRSLAVRSSANERAH